MPSPRTGSSTTRYATSKFRSLRKTTYVFCAHTRNLTSRSQNTHLSPRAISRVAVSHTPRSDIYTTPHKAFAPEAVLCLTADSPRDGAFSEHRYLTCKCDISGAENNAQISDEIKKLISDNTLGGETYLRVMLCGTVGLSTSPNCVALAKECRSTLAGLRVEDSTFVIPDAESLEKDFTVRGELYRVLLPKLSGDDPDERRQAAQALRIGLFALDDRNPLVLLESNDENTGEGL